MSRLNKILKLNKQIYPTGRAFNYQDGGDLDKFHKGIADSEVTAIDDAFSILFQILPDNSNFTADDASRWEERLGLINGTGLSLADRKAAIIRKMNHPGSIKARQSHDYLQDQLQLAGFNVFVHENIPEVPIVGAGIQLGQHQLGQYQLGAAPYLNKVVNSIDEDVDAIFVVAVDYRSTFTIGGAVLGSSTTVLAARKDEFRQLILKIKPVQTVAFLRITYI